MISIAGDAFLMEKIFLPLMDDNVQVFMTEDGWARFDLINGESMDYWENHQWQWELYEDKNKQIVRLITEIHSLGTEISFTPYGYDRYREHVSVDIKVRNLRQSA